MEVNEIVIVDEKDEKDPPNDPPKEVPYSVSQLECQKKKMEFEFRAHFISSYIFTILTIVFAVISKISEEDEIPKTLTIIFSFCMVIIQIAEGRVIDRQKLVDLDYELRKLKENP